METIKKKLAPISRKRTERELMALTDRAELIKDKAYPHYFDGETLEERITGLRNVLRCHFIKVNCGCLNYGYKAIRYKRYKKFWISQEQNRFDKEVLNGL